MLEKIIAAAAVVGIMFSIVGVIYASVSLYRALFDPKKLTELESRVLALEASQNHNDYISDQVANVLYDLFNLITVLKACMELKEENLPVSDHLFDRSNEILFTIEKHFAELGLFSIDDVRRKTVQQALAAKYGDMRTLEIMQQVMQGAVGKNDKGLSEAYTAIRRRLIHDSVVNSSAWTGRPSGGAF